MNLAPIDDPVIPCEVRLWFDDGVVVFVHPREWKSISISGGTPVIVSCQSAVFNCKIQNCGEQFLAGRPGKMSKEEFGVLELGDYSGSAWIDWQSAIPDLLRSKLGATPELLRTWRELPCTVIRAKISHILRAKSAKGQDSRQQDLIRLLSEN